MTTSQKQNGRVRPLNEDLTRALTGAVRVQRKASGAATSTALADALVADALREHATDIHLDPEADGTLVRLRVDGVVQDAAVLPAEQGNRLVTHFKVMAEIDPSPLITPADGRTTFQLDDRELNLRIAGAPCALGEALAIRLLDPAAMRRQLADLGMRDEARDLIENWLLDISGMFLVVGPTGSGKTTTLYALLHELKLRERSVVTIEDPVEYLVEGVNQMQVNEQRGFTFEAGLREVFRLDPDYILIGEIRGAESARAAIDASTSGKIVMSTLHSRDAVGAVSSLRNFEIKDYEIVAGLELVIAQRLVRKLCEKCRKKAAPTAAEKRWLKMLGHRAPAKTWHAQGCDHCNQTGYRRRTGVFEVWRMDEETAQLIAEHADEQTLRRKIRGHGIKSLVEDGLEKAKAGITSFSELQALGGQTRYTPPSRR